MTHIGLKFPGAAIAPSPQIAMCSVEKVVDYYSILAYSDNN